MDNNRSPVIWRLDVLSLEEMLNEDVETGIRVPRESHRQMSTLGLPSRHFTVCVGGGVGGQRANNVRLCSILLLHHTAPVPFQKRARAGLRGLEGKARYLPGLCGWLAPSTELIPPSASPKYKHSKEVWVKNKRLSDETRFSWALRYFSELLLSHSSSPGTHCGICHLPTAPEYATAMSLSSPCPIPTPLRAVSGSCPTLHGRLYLCSVRISRTLSANQIFLAVTSPPDFKGVGRGRIRIQ